VEFVELLYVGYKRATDSGIAALLASLRKA
jgi:hypothetical protein